MGDSNDSSNTTKRTNNNNNNNNNNISGSSTSGTSSTATRPVNAAGRTTQGSKSSSPSSSSPLGRKDRQTLASAVRDENGEMYAPPAANLIKQAPAGTMPGSVMAPRTSAELDPEDPRVVKERLWSLCSSYLPGDVNSLQHSIVTHVEYTLARRRYKHHIETFYQATAHSVRDRLIERWMDTQMHYTSKDCKRVYYLSMEYLIGRSLSNAMHNLGLSSNYARALRRLGYDLEECALEECDPALGNGGLGRLASCFLDSAATLGLPVWGYGIRYKYGMFEQKLFPGKGQMEQPDYWLTRGHPWEVERMDVQYPVRFYGHVVAYPSVSGAQHGFRYSWEGGQVVYAVAYDTPIPGYQARTVNNMRLWSSRPNREFDLASFNEGRYYDAVEEKERCESLASVLYPSDHNEQGRELRLKQQYFFVSATLQDAIRRYLKKPREGQTVNQEEEGGAEGGSNGHVGDSTASFDDPVYMNRYSSQDGGVWKPRIHGRSRHEFVDFPNKVAVQLNDTHPAIAVPELLRLLLDEEGLPYDEAWDITVRTLSFTNHTILPEALETWPVKLFERLLPRHLELLYEINSRFLDHVRRCYPEDDDLPRRVSLFEGDGDWKRVRMAHVAVVGCHAVNGVARMHTHLLKTTLFRDFDMIFPGKIQNKTNGVTPRRWLAVANPLLTELLIKWVGPEHGIETDCSSPNSPTSASCSTPSGSDDCAAPSTWLCDLGKLTVLTPLSCDPTLQAEWEEVKLQNKRRLLQMLCSMMQPGQPHHPYHPTHGVHAQGAGMGGSGLASQMLDVNAVDPRSAMFDIHCKRIHEYKRQLLNILQVVDRYLRLCDSLPGGHEQHLYRQMPGRPAGAPNLVPHGPGANPKLVIFGGKAAPSYWAAKKVIQLILSVASTINTNTATKRYLQVCFVPNYNVSLAETLIPGADMSQHISCAGTEASGTSNMKCAMNGCLLLASRDGANVEIAEAIGESNIFFFGYTPEQVAMARDEARRTASERSMASDANPAEPPLCAFDPARRAASAPPMAEPLPKSYFEGALVADSLPSPSLSTATNGEAAAASASASPITHIPSESQQPAPAPAPAAGTYGGALPGRLARVVEALRCGAFGDPSAFMSILDSLGTEEDLYMVARDWDAYVDAVERADAAYLDRESWTSMAIQAASRMGPFSSDRAIEEYARDIWSTEPCVYDPAANYPDDDRGDEAHRKKRWIQPGYRHQRAVPSGVSLEKLG